jgi:threonine synthase
METTAAFDGLVDRATGEHYGADDPDPVERRRQRLLDPVYDYGAVAWSREELRSRPPGRRYADLLPFPSERTVGLGEGETPLVGCPRLAEEMGVGRVLVKQESTNPTGTHRDRGFSMAATAARERGADAVALPSTGEGAQSAAAYAARAGLESHAFVPARSPFLTKAMVNVHGGEMRVVEGRYPDAEAAFAEAIEGSAWYSVAPFETPYRHEGHKPVAYELLLELDEVPDAVVYPAEGLSGLVGFAKGAREFRELGLVGELPALYAAQAEGCSPLVEAFEAGADDVSPVERPDTICGGLELPDPAGAGLALEALCESGGGAVATPDEEILESAVAVAGREGVEFSASAGAAASAAWRLAEDGAFGPDDTVVLVNTTAGSKDADILRSHLMGQGM